jgi:hypothetical protein
MRILTPVRILAPVRIQMLTAMLKAARIMISLGFSERGNATLLLYMPSLSLVYLFRSRNILVQAGHGGARRIHPNASELLPVSARSGDGSGREARCKGGFGFAVPR